MTAVGLVGLVVVALFLLLIARATSRQGSRDEYDWDDGFDDEEYEDEFDDEDDTPSPSAAVDAPAAAKEATASTDGWTQGSDGTWWYHDPNDGSWWYRGADGVDRRHG